MKKTIVSLMLALAMLLTCALALVSCNQTPTEADPNAAAESFVALDINPSVELTVDDDGYVLSVYGANEDAQVLLYGENGIVGKTLDEAVEKITSIAVELGYIDENNRVISSTVYSDNSSLKAALESKITNSVNKTAQKAGILLTVNYEELYSLVRELDAYKAENPNSDNIQALTPAKYRLAISASENGDITLEEAIELDSSTLIEKINDAHKRAEQFATKAYNKAREDAALAYDLAIAVAMDAVYIEHYSSKILANPTQFMYASFYVAYTNAARGLGALEIAAEYIDEEACADYELTENEIATALDIFGLDDAEVALIQNAVGEVTVRSVGAYADKVLKNIVSDVDKEEVEESIDELLDDAEDRIELLVEGTINNYKPQVDALINSARTSINAMSSAIALIPGLNATFTAMNEEFCAVVSEYEALVADGELSVDDIEELVERFEDKAEEYKAKMDLEMSEEDKAEVEERRAQVKEKMTTEKASFDKALADAEAEAKAYLENLKNKRKQK